MNKEIKDLILTFVKNDSLLALGVLLAALAVQLFMQQEYIYSLVFLVVSFLVLIVRTFRKVDGQVRAIQAKAESDRAKEEVDHEDDEV